MKKFIYSLLFGTSALLMASCMEVDNFDAPDCHFYGKIITLLLERVSFPTGEIATFVYGK